MLAFLFDCSLNRESIVDVYGLVVLSPEPVKSCTQSDVEVQVEKVCSVWTGNGYAHADLYTQCCGF